MNDAEKSKFILDHFGKSITPETIRSLIKGAEYIRVSEQEWKQAVAERLEYYQCAYGL